MRPEEIRKPGWYYRVDDDTYVRLEAVRVPVWKPGVLRSDRPEDIERFDAYLTLEGALLPLDWGGTQFIGPLPTPKARASRARSKGDRRRLLEQPILVARDVGKLRP